MSLVILLILLPGTIELTLICIGAFFKKDKIDPKDSYQDKLIVVIPAHNEEQHISQTIRSLKDCDGMFDILVILDHCTDRTREICLHEGVKIFDHSGKLPRGKNKALECTFNELLKRDYEIFVVVDADSVVEKDFILELKKNIVSGAEAVQVRYDVSNVNESWLTELYHLGLQAYNHLRALGRMGLGLSCGIFGNGFALTRSVLEKVPYQVDSVVEDLAYHLSLVKNGFIVSYVPSTVVRGQMPSTARGAAVQRKRWEGGRLKLLVEFFPQLLRALSKGQWQMIEPALDLLTLPLAYHLILVLILFFLSPILGLVFFFPVVFYVGLSIYKGGGIDDLVKLRHVPRYIVWKLSRLPSIVISAFTEKDWVRSERSKKK